MEVVWSKVRPFNAEHSADGPEAGGFRSGGCAAIATTHPRIAALTTKDAYFSIMARSIRQPSCRVNPESDRRAFAADRRSARRVMIRAAVRECQGARSCRLISPGRAFDHPSR